MISLQNIELLITSATNQGLKNIELWFKENLENFKDFDHSPMMLAASLGNAYVMEWLKKEGLSPEISCFFEHFYGRNADETMKPVHIAALNGHRLAIMWLRNELVDINAKTSTGNTAMHFAAKAGDLFMIRLLKACNCHIDDLNEIGATPLHFAVERGYLDIVKYFAAEKADLKHQNLCGDTLCHLAAANGHMHIVNWLIQQKLEIDRPNYDRETSLHYAAKGGHQDITRALIVNNFKLDSRDVDGKTPLHYAVEYGHLDIVKILHQSGADLHDKDYKGVTLVHIAAQYGEFDIIEWAEKQYLKMDFLDADKDSPVHYAARNGHVRIIEYFYKKGYNINEPNADKETPCFLGVIEGHLNVVKYFYKKEILKLNVPNSRGDYLVHIVAAGGYLDLIKWLIEKGADINFQDPDGNTPLHLAISCKNTEMIKYLKDKGADVNIKNKFNKSALTWSLIHHIEVSLFCSPNAVLDLSNAYLYDYLIKNIDQILSQGTLREKILGGANILKSFETSAQDYDSKGFIQNLSKKLEKIIEAETTNLLRNCIIQNDISKISYYQEQIKDLDSVLVVALESRLSSLNLLDVLNHFRIKIYNASLQIQKIKECISSNDNNNVQNDNMLSLSRKCKDLFEGCSQDHRPYKIQKIWDKATGPTCMIKNNNNEVMKEDSANFDEIEDSLLPMIGEINAKS